MFKQILMISGFDRYFQIVRCFRDEDLRADRQPEFTQIDLEMSYPQPERVWASSRAFSPPPSRPPGIEIKTPFPRMSYDEAMRLYGNDKPDMRLPAMTDVREAFTAGGTRRIRGEIQNPKRFAVATDPHSEGRRHLRHRAPHHRNLRRISARAGASFVQLMTDPKRFAKDYPEISERVLSLRKSKPDDLWLLAGSAR